MKKLILLIIIAFVAVTATGCGVVEKLDAKITGYSSQCVKGVVYYQFASGASVAYNTDGTVKKCK